MGRRNFSTKGARRRHVVTYTPSEVSADYEVLMTNGSGVKRVTVTGTRVSAWNYAIRLGINEKDETMPGVWWPIDINFVGKNDALFSAL